MCEQAVVRTLDKQEFRERFLFDQEKKRDKLQSAKKRNLPAKEQIFLDIVNILYENYGTDIKVNKVGQGLEFEHNDDIFSVKIVTKRNRVKI